MDVGVVQGGSCLQLIAIVSLKEKTFSYDLFIMT